MHVVRYKVSCPIALCLPGEVIFVFWLAFSSRREVEVRRSSGEAQLEEEGREDGEEGSGEECGTEKRWGYSSGEVQTANVEPQQSL